MEWLREAGFRELDSAVLGEFYIGLLLRTLGVEVVDQIASQGWDGDVYAAFGRDEETLVVLATTWDKPSDAREFFDVYRSALPDKYPDANLGDVAETPDGYRLDYQCGDGTGKGTLVLRGHEVFVVEGGDEWLIERLLGDLVDMPIERVD
jgi:hypothetical protein